MEFFHKTTSFQFMRTRKIWYGVSAVMIVLSIVGIFVRGLNLAVDFTGGVTVAVGFPKTVSTDEVLVALERQGFEEPQVTHFGSARDVQVRLPPMGNRTTDQIRGQVEKAVRSVD